MSFKKRKQHKLLSHPVHSFDCLITDATEIPSFRLLLRFQKWHEEWQQYLTLFVPSCLVFVILEYLDQRKLIFLGAKSAFLSFGCRKFLFQWTTWYTKCASVSLYRFLSLTQEHFNPKSCSLHPLKCNKLFHQSRVQCRSLSSRKSVRFEIWKPFGQLCCGIAQETNCITKDENGNLVLLSEDKEVQFLVSLMYELLDLR